jgi:shikimate kinase
VPTSDAPTGDVPAADRSHLVLVGMMGAGKTTIGRAAAARLERPFFDSDELVEARTGRTVREIWEAEGEAAYRPLETEALLDALASTTPAVIAAAGGVVLAETNRRALRAADACVVWLRGDPALLAQRAVTGEHRPLLDGDPEGNLRRLLDQRIGWYGEVADRVVDIEGQSVAELTDRVLAECFAP